MGRPLETLESRNELEDRPTAIFQDIVLLALPTKLFKALSDAAATRQLTTAELLSRAISTYLEETATNPIPTLLTEKK